MRSASVSIGRLLAQVKVCPGRVLNCHIVVASSDHADRKRCQEPNDKPDAKTTSACGTDNGLFKYVWDAENRLIEIVPVSPSDGDIKLVFDYDYMSRRVRKQEVEWDDTLNGGDWKSTANTDLRFIYDQWNVVMVLDGNDSNDIDRKCTWGLDMAGQAGATSVAGIHGAGGIGGLLSAWDDTSGSARLYWYFYDGNGNVVQVLEYDDSSDTLNTTPVAHYEYDPYGNIINDLSSYSYAEDNPFRFSTKWLDDELAEASQSGAVGEEGLYYYGYRYYSPTMGRWMSRDPIEESGGMNLYLALSNDPLDVIDLFGMSEWNTGMCKDNPACEPPSMPKDPDKKCYPLLWQACMDRIWTKQMARTCARCEILDNQTPAAKVQCDRCAKYKTDASRSCELFSCFGWAHRLLDRVRGCCKHIGDAYRDAIRRPSTVCPPAGTPAPGGRDPGNYNMQMCFHDCDLVFTRCKQEFGGKKYTFCNNTWNACNSCCRNKPDPSCAGVIGILPPDDYRKGPKPRLRLR